MKNGSQKKKKVCKLVQVFPHFPFKGGGRIGTKSQRTQKVRKLVQVFPYFLFKGGGRIGTKSQDLGHKIISTKLQ